MRAERYSSDRPLYKEPPKGFMGGLSMDKQHDRPGGIQDPPLYFQPSIGDQHSPLHLSLY